MNNPSNQTCDAGQAENLGFATFNGVPHLCVDVPDGGFTISAKTTQGKRVTFAFMPYEDDGAPQCVDIQYHDSGTRHDQGPTFDFVAFGLRQPDIDTRKLRPEPEAKPGILCVLMDNDYEK